MPKGVRGFQRKIAPVALSDDDAPVLSVTEVVKKCAECNEWLMMGICSRDGSRKSSKSIQCDAKVQGK